MKHNICATQLNYTKNRTIYILFGFKYICKPNSLQEVLIMPSVQLRVPEQMIKYLDEEIVLGKFSNRSEAIKLILYEYIQKEKTKHFIEELDKRSKDACQKKNLTALKDL